jgi:acetolactate decarboxylase
MASAGVVGETAAVLDERWIKALHVQTLHEEDLHADHEPHVLFQASTIGALLDGAYEGDLSIAELAEQGDLGLGTLNGLDGEMIAVDGRFYRADVEGTIHAVEPQARTPFAVVCDFEPQIETRIAAEPRDGRLPEPGEGPLSHKVALSHGEGLSHKEARSHEGALSHEVLLSRLDELIPAGSSSCAIRLEGDFDLVRARSVPRQSPPYRPLTEVVAEQNVFELGPVAGTMVGFRFPAYVEGIEVGGYHLHFISEDRTRGGHVLDSRCRELRVRLDPSNELHVELPPSVDLADPDLASATHRAVELVERG